MSNTRWAKAVDGLSVVVMIVVLAGMAVVLLKKPGGSSGRPEAIPVGSVVDKLQFLANAAGTERDTTLLFAEGPRVIYVFATTCSYCQRQKAEIAKYFGSKTAGQFVTASPEDIAVTWDYWGEVAPGLPAPMRIPSETSRILQAVATPYLLAIDRSGRVRFSRLGIGVPTDSLDAVLEGTD